VNYGVTGRLKSIISLSGDHQKGGDCKENGPRAIWLNEFWCLLINTTCELMCLLVFMFIVHRMRRGLD
jgi:hypothetical protein